MGRAALRLPSQVRHHLSQGCLVRTAMGLPQVRLEVDMDPHLGLLIIMGGRLVSLAVLVDLAVLLLVPLHSGSQMRMPMAHRPARRVSRVGLQEGRLTRMVGVVGGKLWC